MTYEIMLDLARIVRDNFGGRITNATYVYSENEGIHGHLFIVPESGISNTDGMAGVLGWHANNDGTNAEIVSSSIACYSDMGAKINQWMEEIRNEGPVAWTLFPLIYDELDHGRE